MKLVGPQDSFLNPCAALLSTANRSPTRGEGKRGDGGRLSFAGIPLVGSYEKVCGFGIDMSRSSTISEIRELDDGHAVVSPRRTNSPAAAAAAACERRESPVTSPRSGARKLFDLVHLAHHAQRASAGGNSGGKAKWRSLRDRFRRAGAAWLAASSASEVAVSPGRRGNQPIIAGSVPRSVSVRNPWPISDPELVSKSNRPGSVRRPLSVSLSVSVRNSEPPAPEPPSAPAPEKVVSENIPKPMPDDDGEEEEEEEEEEEDEEEHSGSSAAAPAMSLMALLEQTDEWGGSGKEDEEEEEEVGTDEESEGADDGMLYVCCVCMVQHKGARFTSCGHTFCRLCSRELWVTNSECPLCNGYILEILEIF
ncbi:uncharacterized protein LOC122031499 [Zingiber officinale]|uniref:RING-type domain-containing protein n=1 Tax=Zingiber officinale TaxID=94328 RepID=A0A8J5EQP3_ZINOF|nr:uncharacterized protein LOC122031499 [Zingiber officinale]KAG6470613.1 hypothetical protein ZIOFF_071688 [Zingiber officinale]